MHVDDISDRIAIARADELDCIVRSMWTDHANGLLTEGDMEALDEAARTRREAVQAAAKRRAPELPFPMDAPRASARRPQPCQSPDRAASIRRRRRIGYSGVLPPPIAELFTVGQTAAIRIVLDEIRDHGRCTLPNAIIAARSGTSKSTVRRAMRAAREHGIIAVMERRSTRRGVLSDTNVVTLISPEVRSWIFRRGGRQKWRATDTSDSNTCFGRYINPPTPGRRQGKGLGEGVPR
jgi:hypothetical protein